MKGRDDNAKTYTRSEIAALKKECEQELPESIANTTTAREQAEKKLQQQRFNATKFKEEKIDPLTTAIHALDMRCQSLTIPGELQNLKDQRAELLVELQELTRELESEGVKLTSLSNTHYELTKAVDSAELYLKVSPEYLEVDSQESALRNANRELSRLQSEDTRLEREIKDKESELSRLRSAAAFDYSFNHSGFGGHHHGHHHHGHHHGHHDYGYSSTLHNMNDIYRDTKIINLQSDLVTLRRNSNDACRRVTDANNMIGRLKSSLEASQTSLRNSAAMSKLNNLKSQRDIAYRNYQVQCEKVNRLNEKNGLLNLNNKKLRSDIQKKETDLDMAVSFVEASQDKSLGQKDLSTVRAELENLNAQYIDATSTHGQLECEVRRTQKNIVDQSKELQNLQERKAKLEQNKFLQGYDQLAQNEYGQHSLLEQLSNSLFKALATFEKDHPANQSIRMRQCLHDLPLQRLSIMDDNERTLQDKYWLLSGSINHAISTLGQQNNELAVALRGALARHLLDKNEAEVSFTTYLEQRFDSVSNISEDGLRADEAKQYREVVTVYRELLSEKHADARTPLDRELNHYGRKLLNSIHALEKKGHNPQLFAESFDIKFHTKMLRASMMLMIHPYNHVLQLEVASYIQHNMHGKPSVGRRVAGVLTMLLGVAMIAGAVALGVLSFGLTSPLSIAGIAVGGAAFLLGLGLVVKSVSRGLDKSLHGLHSSAMLFQAPPINYPDDSAYHQQPTAPPANYM